MKAVKQTVFSLAFAVLAALAIPAHSANANASANLQSESLLSATTPQAFEYVLARAQETLTEHGFAVAHVQLCDGGLQARGYESEGYKVIFFGRGDEVRDLSKRYPQLIPLLPFKMAVQAEQGNTVVSLVNPAELADLLHADAALATQLSQWEQEFRAVLADLAEPVQATAKQLAQTHHDTAQ